MSGATLAPPRVQARRGRFFANSALAMLAAVLFSFPLTYYGPLITGSRQFGLLFHVHGAAFFGWMFLYVWQTHLAATGRTALHREIGLAGVALSALMIPLGLAAALAAAQHRLDTNAPRPFEFTLYNLVDIGLFAAFMTASIANVTRGLEWHRRFTYAAALCLVGPAISRWFLPFPSFPPFTDFGPNILADLFLVPLALHDRRCFGRIHPATLWAAAIMLTIHFIEPVFATSRGWASIAPGIFAFTRY
ncbi:MAG: hypothetical protein JSR60_05850 [Proteobacteria bacterium]|nr:hypothetical protein [Pseudomonadota bacterium]